MMFIISSIATRTFDRPESSVAIANYVTSNLPKKTAFILDPSPSSSMGPDSVRTAHAQTPPGGLAKLVALEMGKEGFSSSDMVLAGVPPTFATSFRYCNCN